MNFNKLYDFECKVKYIVKVIYYDIINDQCIINELQSMNLYDFECKVKTLLKAYTLLNTFLYHLRLV